MRMLQRKVEENEKTQRQTARRLVTLELDGLVHNVDDGSGGFRELVDQFSERGDIGAGVVDLLGSPTLAVEVLIDQLEHPFLLDDAGCDQAHHKVPRVNRDVVDVVAGVEFAGGDRQEHLVGLLRESGQEAGLHVFEVHVFLNVGLQTGPVDPGQVALGFPQGAGGTDNQLNL